MPEAGAITVTWAQVLVLVALVLAVYVIEMLVFMRQSKRLQAGAADPLALRLEAELNAVRERAETLNARMDELQRELELLRRSQATPAQYRDAVELAQDGGDATSIATTCGISRGEAELIVALQRMKTG